MWILFQGAMPMATTRTLDEVLAKEWSLTAWPKCLVMPKRRPFVRIQAPAAESCTGKKSWGGSSHPATGRQGATVNLCSAPPSPALSGACP